MFFNTQHVVYRTRDGVDMQKMCVIKKGDTNMRIRIKGHSKVLLKLSLEELQVIGDTIVAYLKHPPHMPQPISEIELQLQLEVARKYNLLKRLYNEMFPDTRGE